MRKPIFLKSIKKYRSVADARPPFIRNVIHPTEIKVKTEFSVILEGDWPTPSWEHEYTDIDINEADNVLTIKYLGYRRAGVALQVIKSFKVDFKIILSKLGEWKLLIVGKNENWESKLIVHEND